MILAVQELAEGAAKRSGAQLELSLPDRLDRCPSPTVEQGIYRIAQETLENIIRHAGRARSGSAWSKRALKFRSSSTMTGKA